MVNPSDERPEGPHAACLGYGCHECLYTGEDAVAVKEQATKERSR